MLKFHKFSLDSSWGVGAGNFFPPCLFSVSPEVCPDFRLTGWKAAPSILGFQDKEALSSAACNSWWGWTSHLRHGSLTEPKISMLLTWEKSFEHEVIMLEVTLNFPHSLFYDLYQNRHALVLCSDTQWSEMDTSWKLHDSQKLSY